jgi:uncharacterized protein
MRIGETGQRIRCRGRDFSPRKPGLLRRHRDATDIDARVLEAKNFAQLMRKKEIGMGGEILRAVNQTRGTILCAHLDNAGGIAGQSRGLLGRDRLEPEEGMLFVRGRFEPFMWMHMFFMRFPIDIVFLDGEGTVVRIERELKPWRVSSIVLRARKALELEAGAAARSQTELGDQISLEQA